MAYSYVSYTGNGVETGYSIPFEYIQKSHVTVYLQGIEKTVDVHYTYTTDSTIAFSIAPPDENIVFIQRNSGRDERMVDFVSGSILTEAIMDLNSTQLFYLMQEGFDSLGLAGETDSGYFNDPQAVLDIITGEIDETFMKGDFKYSSDYLLDYWLSDAVFEESVYDYGVHAQGTARIDLHEAQITLLAELFEEGGGEFGSRLTQVEIDMDAAEGAITASAIRITDNEGDISTQSGVMALMQDQFYVKLDDNGNISGFGIYSDETEGSAFVVNADKFGIIKDDGLGDIKYPFVVDAVTGIIGIQGSLVVTNSITATQINADAIEATHISTGSVVADGIGIGAVVEGKIGAGAITTTKIGSNAIETSHINANAITADEINADAVTAAKISVDDLSSIKADVGTLNAGLLQSSDETMQISLTNKWIKIYDGSDNLRVHLGYIA